MTSRLNIARTILCLNPASTMAVELNAAIWTSNGWPRHLKLSIRLQCVSVPSESPTTTGVSEPVSSTAEQEKRMSPISMPACSAALSCRTFSTIAIVASGPQVKVIPMLWAGRSTSRYMSSRPAVRMTVALRFRLELIPSHAPSSSPS